MFTGIIECLGTVLSVTPHLDNVVFEIESPFLSELKVDQSVAHDGVCLTITDLLQHSYKVTAVSETLSKTNLNSWKPGRKVNLERAMCVGDRLDGHFVQGHVDTIAKCIDIIDRKGSYEFVFNFPEQYAALLIPKGSVCINGVSLTVINPTTNQFSVAIIPYTYQHTNFHALQMSDEVNIEFDVLGKYIRRYYSLQEK